MNDDKLVLNVIDLCKTYHLGEHTVAALDHVSFELCKGEYLAITGKSGSGKSTLLHMIGMMDDPDSGKVIIDGTDVSELKPSGLSRMRRDFVGFVFQDFKLLPELNVMENICVPALLKPGKLDMEYINSIIEMLGLSEYKQHTPDQLSGGQKQRTAIARAVVNRPALLLCDEPTGNLDKKSSMDVMNMIEKIQAALGTSIIIVTHDPDIAKKAGRIITIEDGKISK